MNKYKKIKNDKNISWKKSLKALGKIEMLSHSNKGSFRYIYPSNTIYKNKDDGIKTLSLSKKYTINYNKSKSIESENNPIKKTISITNYKQLSKRINTNNDITSIELSTSNQTKSERSKLVVNQTDINNTLKTKDYMSKTIYYNYNSNNNTHDKNNYKTRPSSILKIILEENTSKNKSNYNKSKDSNKYIYNTKLKSKLNKYNDNIDFIRLLSNLPTNIKSNTSKDRLTKLKLENELRKIKVNEPKLKKDNDMAYTTNENLNNYLITHFKVERDSIIDIKSKIKQKEQLREKTVEKMKELKKKKLIEQEKIYQYEKNHNFNNNFHLIPQRMNSLKDLIDSDNQKSISPIQTERANLTRVKFFKNSPTKKSPNSKYKLYKKKTKKLTYKNQSKTKDVSEDRNNFIDEYLNSLKIDGGFEDMSNTKELISTNNINKIVKYLSFIKPKGKIYSRDKFVEHDFMPNIVNKNSFDYIKKLNTTVKCLTKLGAFSALNSKLKGRTINKFKSINGNFLGLS